LKNAAEITIETADASHPAQTPPVREPEAPSTAKSSPDSNTNSIVEPPSVDIGAQDSTKQLAALGDTPNAMPTLEARVSQGITGGELIRKVNPVYPMQAREQRLAGSVTLEITIGKDGVVHDIKQVSGSHVLAAAASDAIYKWRYNPFLLNGSPVQMQKEITILFKLP
jgi:TonB family protein